MVVTCAGVASAVADFTVGVSVAATAVEDSIVGASIAATACCDASVDFDCEGGSF